ncbi:monosaccharide-sensing protein 3-like [Gastrolobium bilobum]|uniref:monosaccharide-sensing protein 3-like n=1 Tax=Gastrolobium bilobum TaxID=150636 RepID=UPI002AB21F7F|nr:monosaccharide-sensing protein 3-like [Gastrolobium bilobum]
MREVVIVAIAATLGNLLVGWDSSTIAGGMTYIKKEFKLESDPTLEGLIVSMSFLTGTVVTIFSGTVSDMIGRRPMLITSSVMFFFSGLVMLWAPNVLVVLLSRLLDGVAIALSMTLTPLYISEIAPPDIRGLLNTLPQFSCSGGMFVAYILVFCMSLMDSPSWRAMFGVVSIPSVAYFFLAVFYLPESPPWLVSKGRIPEAKKVLQRIRGVEDVSAELALLGEGLNPGGEGTTIEEYIVSPASDLIANKEAGRDCIKLYGPKQGVSMIAQPVNGQGSMISRSTLTLSRQGSIVTQPAALKDPLVNLFGSMHENIPTESVGSRGMLIPKVWSVSSMADHDQSPFGTSDNLHAPLLSSQGSVIEKDKAFGSNSGMRSNNNLISCNSGEVPKNTNIGGGWQLVYKSAEGTGGGKKEGGGLQRVYLKADPNAVSRQGSFVSSSGCDLHAGGGEAFPAAALVSRSVLGVKDMKIKPEVSPKRTGWGSLLEPGVKRALFVGIGLQVLQQAAGINGFLYYAPQILEQAGVGALLSNLGISATSGSLLVNVFTTFSMLPCIAISMRLMDISGRRSIMLYTIPILIVSLMVLVLRESFHISSTLNAAITAICVVVYESVFCMGFGVIPNILCSEIFPTSVRGICISICSLTYWMCTLIVTSQFPFLLQLLGLTGVFGLFVVGCIISWIFVYLKVPETKGMPLEVIIEFFAIGSKPE